MINDDPRDGENRWFGLEVEPEDNGDFRMVLSAGFFEAGWLW